MTAPITSAASTTANGQIRQRTIVVVFGATGHFGFGRCG